MKIDKFYMKNGYSHYKYREIRSKVNKFLNKEIEFDILYAQGDDLHQVASTENMYAKFLFKYTERHSLANCYQLTERITYPISSWCPHPSVKRDGIGEDYI